MPKDESKFSGNQEYTINDRLFYDQMRKMQCKNWDLEIPLYHTQELTGERGMV